MTILHDMVTNSPRLSDATKKVYLVDIERWIKFAGSDPTAWTRYRAQEFYASLLPVMKSQSANRVMASLRYAASWWAKMESNPALDFTQIQLAKRKAREKRNALTLEEATQLITSIAASKGSTVKARDFALVVVGLETGMRREGLADMAIDRTNVTTKPSALVKVKGHDERYSVPLSQTACTALGPWLSVLRGAKVTSGSVFRSISKSIEPGTSIGASITGRGIYNVVSERAEEAGIGRVIHPHLFRHSFVTWRLQAEVPEYLISVTTGHRMKGDAMPKAMAEYADKDKLADQARATTPAWLSTLVEQEIAQL